MAASASPDASLQAPEVNMADAPPEGEQEMLPLPSWDATTTSDYREKYMRYQAAYSRRLKAKYFSNKTLDGEAIFDQEMNIEGETIKSGRWPCTRSFVDQSADFGVLTPARKVHLKSG